MNGLLGSSTDSTLKETGKTKLELHQVAGKHHHILHKSLELKQICLHILYLATATTDALINLFEEVVVHLIELLQHFLTTGLLTDAQFATLGRNTQGSFKHTQVGQCIQIGDTQICSHHCLKIDANQGHEIFHAPNFLFCISRFTTEDF